MKPKIMTEETYLAINGSSRGDIGESALHHNRAKHSDRTWNRMVDAQAKKDHGVIIRRGQLRIEYAEKVASGELRPPTRLESLMDTANGHEDNQATQAARRLLKRKGYDWKIGERNIK